MSEEKKVLRHELKYFINETDYLWLRDRIAAVMPLDQYAPAAQRGYGVRSLYYDDILDDALFDKTDGEALRNKFRIRVYSHNKGRILLEKKSKVMYYTAKDSVTLTKEQCTGVLSGDYSLIYPSDSELLREFYALIRTTLLKPKVIVDYFREPYVYPAGNIRITFDLNVRSGLYNKDLFEGVPACVPALDAGTHILEVKYDTFLPEHLRAVLQGIPGQRIAVSKYVMCRRFH